MLFNYNPPSKKTVSVYTPCVCIREYGCCACVRRWHARSRYLGYRPYSEPPSFSRPRCHFVRAEIRNFPAAAGGWPFHCKHPPRPPPIARRRCTLYNVLPRHDIVQILAQYTRARRDVPTL